MLEFNQQLYLSASFFKMKTTGSPSVDRKINASVKLQNFPHPEVQRQVIPARDSWVKQKQKNVLRGESVVHYNNLNDSLLEKQHNE